MNVRSLIRGCMFGALLLGCASAEPGASPGLPPSAASSWAKLTRTTLVIPQVDYEPAIFHKPDDPYPHIDFERVDRKKVVQKPHDAVVLENELVRITVLPAMGRIYSFVFKATGHENLWHNDVVNVLPQAGNPLGWWIWMGGIEYTLPVEEHGSTFALRWSWSVTEDSPSRKAVRMRVKEPVTLLEETIEVALVPGHSYYEAKIAITNPTNAPVSYAHWVNSQWTPGGKNELTDNTEFIIPTDRIIIVPEWQKNMGPSPQEWAGNKFRTIRGWLKMGDLMADVIKEGFYGAYSHDALEGMVRVFDKDKNPGVDIWTYGFAPKEIPMGSGGPSRGYVEMWGGTTKTYGPERSVLAAGASIMWTDWMFPFQGTGGLTYADRDRAVSFTIDPRAGTALIGLCPSGAHLEELELLVAPVTVGAAAVSRSLQRWSVDVRPDRPFLTEVPLTAVPEAERSRLRLRFSAVGSGIKLIEPEPRP